MSEDKTKEEDSKISLSAALLAPINSIFEAQIHAGRAFLSFVLQMGFKHKQSIRKKYGMTDEEIERIDENIRKESEAKEKIKALIEKKKAQGSLSTADIAELRRLRSEYGDLHMQPIEYMDGSGQEYFLGIPNLALVPIKPLAVSEADFSFRFNVLSQTKSFDQMGAALGNKPKEERQDEPEARPWYLIRDPKSLRGEIVSQKNPEDYSMQINVKVTNTEIPYGLEKLLIHLTNEIEPIKKNN